MPNFVAKNDFITPTFERFADQLFVEVRPIHIGGVPEKDAQFEGAVERF